MAQAHGGLTDRPGRCVNERFKAAENLNGPFTRKLSRNVQNDVPEG